jgi:hypothetical protein
MSAMLSSNLLSETDRAQTWLDQFLPEDQSTALSLLESLQLVTRDEFDYDLASLIEAHALQIPEPIALFAVRDVVKGEPYYLSEERPNAVSNAPGVGSEAIIAYLLSGLHKKYGWLDHPGLKIMRNEKVRSVIVVNDTISSGKQSRNFIEWFYAHPTMMSWTSTNLIRMDILVHSATEMGCSRVMKGNAHWLVKYSHVYGSITAEQRSNQARKLRTLCTAYAERGQIPSKWALGFEQTFSGVVFPHKCPNTCPGILWYSKSQNWKPLFESRASLGFCEWPLVTTPERQLQRLFSNVGQHQLANLSWMSELGESAPLKLAVLAIASRRFRKRTAISEILRVSLTQLNGLIDECVQQGWLTINGRLTESGLRILKAARKLGINKEQPEWPDPDEFYFLHKE